MVKIRIKGVLNEIDKAMRILSKVKAIELVDFSEPIKDRGECTYHVYGNIKFIKKSDKKGE